MKLISVVVPVYNEIRSLDEAYTRITSVMRGMAAYEYEIVFFDDGSADGSREKIEQLCAEDEHVRAVFYTKNFGYAKSTFYCMQQAKGDCAVIVHADMQNPPEKIPEFVEKWEQGSDAVLGVKTASKENKLVFFIRTLFYFIMNKVFGTKLIPHATEFELFDRRFLDVLKKCELSEPFLRSLILEYCGKIDRVYYVQDKRGKGKSKFSVKKYYDFAMNGVVAMSRNLPRIGITVSLLAMLGGLLEFFINYLPDIIGGRTSEISTGIMIRLVFLFLGFILLFGSLIAEYVLSAAAKADKKPMITEEKRINY